MHTRLISGASPALVELLQQNGELDNILDGRGLTFESVPAPPATLPATFIIEPADWDQEERERQALERKREQQERDKVIAEELARLEEAEPPSRPTPPAPRKRRSWLTKGEP